jgi:initiation factor 1A
MPNLQGGKKYKSSKHSQESKAILHPVEEGQQIGRILKVLGNKRMIVYCNDNTQRICKIRGALGKRSWIEKGDIVLISIREDLAAGTTGTTSDSTIAVAATASAMHFRLGDRLAERKRCGQIRIPVGRAVAVQ